MSRENKKLRVYEEDVKTRHTAHWDWDYLPWKEVERRLQEGGIIVEERVAQKGRYIGGGRRRAAVVWIGLGLLILAGVLLAVI